MPLEIAADTPKEVVPLAWLLGSWAGVGVLDDPEIGETQFGQEVVFAHHGQPFLAYTSTCWALDEQGEKTRIIASESGYWRALMPVDPEAAAKAAAGIDVEVTLCHPIGHVEIYVGRSHNGQIDLATDVVARTATASGYAAAKRLYGFVEGDLLWVWDELVSGEGMRSRASARLKRVSP